MDLKLLKMRCKDSKQHHVMFHELYSVSLLSCIAQNVRFEIPYKDLYFETPFLIIFKCYAWVSCDTASTGPQHKRRMVSLWENNKKPEAIGERFLRKVNKIYMLLKK